MKLKKELLTNLAAVASIAITLALFAERPADAPARSARVSVSLLDDATGQPTAVRVRLTDAAGNPVPPPDAAAAVMYLRPGDKPGYTAQPDGAFYVEGSFTAELPAGRYRLALSKGSEFLAQEHDLEVAAGRPLEQTYRLKHWINSAARGWYSADDHIHIRRSPRENPPLLAWIAAEDLNVGVLLQWGDLFGTQDHQYAFSKAGVYQAGDRLLTSGQEEPRTHEIGHTMSFGADEFVRLPRAYYRYDYVFDRVHQLHGVTGYAHQGMSYHAYRGMTMDVLAGKTDFLELLQFCVEGGPLHLEHYYEFLDLGYKLTATAGSDFPFCGTGHLEGASFAPVIQNPQRTWKNAAFSQFPRSVSGKELMGYSMRTDRHCFTRWVHTDDHSQVEAVELYDHQTDPQENVNIAGDPKNADIVAKLTEQWLQGWRGAVPK